MKRFDCFVSAIVRIHNDGALLADFVRSTHRALADAFAHFELILVDDGSTDGSKSTLEPILKELHSIRVLRMMRTFGYEAAITAGIDSAIGDYVVLLDARTDPPELIPDFVHKTRTTNRVVFGVSEPASREKALYRIGRKLFYQLSHRFLDVKLVENSTRFMAFNRQTLNALTSIGDRQRFMRLFAMLVTGQGETIPYQQKACATTSRKSVHRNIGRAISILVQNSNRPLRLVSTLGLAASLVNLLTIVYIAGVVAFKKHIAEGWVTLSLQNACMFFVINLTLAVVAEYVLRILDESRNFPIYFLHDETNSSVIIPAESRRNVVLESVVEAGGE